MKTLHRVHLKDFKVAIIRHLEATTNFACHGDGANHKPPFYYVQVVNKVPADTKTFFQDLVTFNIHCIGEEPDAAFAVQGSGDTAQVLDMIGEAEDAFTVDVDFGPCYGTALQTEIGLVNQMIDPSGEPRAIVQFAITVRYGMKVK